MIHLERGFKMDNIVATRGLTKVLNGKEIISDVDMTVKKGEIYGFLGPNGAGKTTIMKMLINLIKPTSGEMTVFGKRVNHTSHELLKRMGSMIEYPIFYEKLSARENLELHCDFMGFHNKHTIDTTLDMVNLHDIHHEPVKNFSLGMKQRLGIARAILTKPELLILDEPINGLDPVGIKNIRDLFFMLNKDYGITMIISSHILKEIEQIADTIGLIRNGKMITEVSMDSIRSKHTEYIELVVTNIKRACFVLENKLQMTNFKVINDKYIRLFDLNQSQSYLSKTLILNDVEIESINRKHTSLENYFMDQVEENGGQVI